jgi:transposase
MAGGLAMSRAYSSDLRQRIVDAITQGETRRAAAAAFKVSPATAVRLKQRADRTGSVEPSRRGRPSGGGKLGPYQDAIIAKVEAQPDVTMPDLATWLEEYLGVKADPSNLSKLLCRAGFTYKKNATGIGTRTRRRAPGAR